MNIERFKVRYSQIGINLQSVVTDNYDAIYNNKSFYNNIENQSVLLRKKSDDLTNRVY